MDIEIEEMSPADYDDVMALWREVEGVGLSGADSREGILAFLDRNPGLSLVSRLGGDIVGAVLCGHDGRRGYLHHLAVAPRHRRRGIGRALVVGSLSRLRAHGIEKCHVFIHSANASGEGFWSGIGWESRPELKMMSKKV